MRPLKAFLGALCALAVLALAATAGASVQRVSFPVDDTFQDEFHSDVCGFDVFINIKGTARVQLFLDDAGNVVREIDTFSGFVTYTSDTGSFRFPLAQPIIFDYGAGAEIGSTATIKLVGLSGHATGFIASDAGIIILTGTVVDFSPEGIPIVDFDGEVTFQHGNFEEGDRIDAAICAALS
jgi:hypothetical protein